MMKLKLLAISALTVALTLTLSASGPKAKAYGSCKLTNIAQDKVIYHSDCKVVEKIKNNGEAIFKIKLGATEPFLFASYDGRKHWMHGAHQVQFREIGTGGAIFKWDDFVLSVAID